jgi:FkbM family methyltransferase
MIKDLRRMLLERRKRRSLQQGVALTPYGFRFSGNKAMTAGEFEPIETRLIREELKRADCFVDVGANIGYYSMHALSMGKKVFAFEPSTDNLRVFYYNLELNNWRDCEAFPVGLGSAAGLHTLHGDSTGASMIPGWGGAAPSQQTLIPVNTLDNMIAHRLKGHTALIKIDVEGAEYPVLVGASAALDLQPAPVWLVEICFNENFPGGRNEQYEATFQRFFEHGYRAFSAEAPDRDVDSKSVSEWVISGERPRGVGHNFIFKK